MLAFPPDYTFVIQLASFFVMLFILNRLLFRPYLQLLAERESRTTGDAEAAGAETAAAEELKAGIEAQLADARSTAFKQVEELRAETKAAESRLFEAARSESASMLAELRAGIEKERSEAQSTLAGEAKQMAAAMVKAVLGQGAGA